MSPLLSRKFLLASATLAAATAMLYLGELPALLWRDVVLGTVGAYLAANVVQKVQAK